METRNRTPIYTHSEHSARRRSGSAPRQSESLSDTERTSLALLGFASNYLPISCFMRACLISICFAIFSILSLPLLLSVLLTYVCDTSCTFVCGINLWNFQLPTSFFTVPAAKYLDYTIHTKQHIQPYLNVY